MKFLIYLLLAFSLFGCSNTTSTKIKTDWEREIENLQTVEKRRTYLEQIYTKDQKVRQSEIEANQKFGYLSSEHENSLNEIITVDAENTKRIEFYLSKYGHPKIEDYGKLATNTPFFVIHHAQLISTREKNFNYFYNAYKTNNIRETEMSFYLNRWYRMKYNKEFERRDDEGEIEGLLKALGLSDE